MDVAKKETYTCLVKEFFLSNLIVWAMVKIKLDHHAIIEVY